MVRNASNCRSRDHGSPPEGNSNLARREHFHLPLFTSLTHRTVDQILHASSVAFSSPDTPFLSFIVKFKYIGNHTINSSKSIENKSSLHHLHVCCRIENQKTITDTTPCQTRKWLNPTVPKPATSWTLIETTPSLNLHRSLDQTARVLDSADPRDVESSSTKTFSQGWVLVLILAQHVPRPPPSPVTYFNFTNPKFEQWSREVPSRDAVSGSPPEPE